MDLITRTSGLAIAAIGTLCCAPAAFAASASTEPLQASGGLTLGSAALIGLAGVVVAFGSGRSDDSEAASATPINHRDQGLLRTAPQEEFHDES